MIATTDQYAAMLDAASAGGYALAAVNVTSSETLNGAMRGFAEAGADGIVQITTGAASSSRAPRSRTWRSVRGRWPSTRASSPSATGC
jgi:fructose/tagatose bisphosphate aldolase